MQLKNSSWIITIIICILIGAVFGYLYFHNHSFGTWGDDSAGYIYLWGKLDQGKPLVYQEPLTVKALEFFNDEKLARWTTPTHHEIISPSGYIASKYPIGLSLIMYVFSTAFNSDLAIYYVLPVLAAANLILVFLIANIIFINNKYKHFLSLLASSILGLATIYYEYAISQPMREIPSMFFMLFGYYIFLLWFTHQEKTKKTILWVVFALALFILGLSLNIRETSLVVIPAFAVLTVILWNKKHNKKQNIKNYLKITGLAVAMFIVAVIPTIYNSYKISEHKEKFKKKDISSIAITSNFDHISSFSISNIFDNSGKFRPGRGALPHYWDIMNKMSALPYFIILAIIGLIYLHKRNKWLSASLLLWMLGFLAIFSLWVNPYSRYILPLFPILAILASFGLYKLITKIVPYYFKSKKTQTIIGVIIILSLVSVYYPVLADIRTEYFVDNTMVYKAITQDDLNNLKDLSNNITNSPSLPARAPLVIFSGTWQYGISETFEAHTGIQAIRMPVEQKYTFETDKVKQFFDETLLSDYNVYIWMDETTKAASLEFLENFTLEEKYKYSFSFEPEIIIYQIHATTN